MLNEVVKTPAVPFIQQANFLMNGITASLDASGEEYEWNQAALVYDFPIIYPTFDLNVLVQQIASRDNLVIVISNNDPVPNRFAFYARHSYYETAGTANVQDDSGTLNPI